MKLKWINTGAFAVMIAGNALFNLLPLGGSTTGQISEFYPNLFTPAPLTFSIWGLIYLMMALFVIYQWGVMDGGTYSDQVRERIGLWFAVSCVLNTIWLVFWHMKAIELSVISMLLLLAVLIVISRRLSGTGNSYLLRVSASAGFSVYLGWIIAASFANVCIWLTKINGNEWGLSSDLTTILLMLFGTVIAASVILLERNRIAGAAIMWAYAGILIRHVSAEYYGGTHPYVIAVGFLCELIMLAAILIPRSAVKKGKPDRVSIQNSGKNTESTIKD